MRTAITFLVIFWLSTFRIALADTSIENLSTIDVISEKWPPYIVINNVATGLEVDIAREVFKQISIKMTFSEAPWKRSVLMVKKNQADAILGIFSNSERKEYFYFPDEPLLKVSYAVFSLTNKPLNYQKISDLSGLSVAITNGYFYSQEFSDATDIQKIAVTSVKQSFGMLALDRVDAVIENLDVGNYYIRLLNLNDKITAAAQPLTTPQPHYIAFAKTVRNRELVKRFSDKLKQFKQTPSYNLLLQKYGR